MKKGLFFYLLMVISGALLPGQAIPQASSHKRAGGWCHNRFPIGRITILIWFISYEPHQVY